MADRPKRARTSTSNFGVGKRENHDASGFYERFATPLLSSDDEVTVAPAVDRIWVHDARSMSELPDGSVALVVTSPPYFAGKAYEEALGEGHIPADYVEYLDMLTAVFAECARVLEPGGRMAVNVANLGRKPYRSLSADVIHILQDRLGLLLRGEIVWQKARGAAGNCAWGSFQSAKNPVLRDLTERVVVASKGRFDRARSTPKRSAAGLPAHSTIGKDRFLDLTLDLWEFPPESATRVGHPAPFPVELPRRLIDLYTFEGDLVLDPFMGSGSTGVAAVESGRHFVGYDTDPAYAQAALERIDRARQDHEWEVKQRADAMAPLLFAELTKARQATANDMVDLQRQASRDGSRAHELVRLMLEQCGFGDDLRTSVRFPVGIEVDFAATDAKGCEWLFSVTGAFTSTRPGLRQADVLWKTLGQAAILQTQFRGKDRPCRHVLLTTDVPDRSSAGAKALREAQSAGLIWDVLVIDEPETVAELLHYASAKRSRPSDRRPGLTAYP
jgi:site-specific DNA-methyltransferase (adenine-specific)